MRALARFPFPALLALGLAACGAPPSSTDGASSAPTAAVDPPALAPMAEATDLDTDALRARAASSLAANRLHAPAGDNAVEDYLALRERQPEDAAAATALADLAPYVIIGAEQATAQGAFDEAARLVVLLARMDPEAPAVPRLREALATARADAAARTAEAEQTLAAEARATAERRAGEARASVATTTAPPSTPPAIVAETPAPAVADTTTAPASTPARPAEPRATPEPAPPRPAAPPARALVSRTSPRFPEAAARRRLEGEVEVSVRIAADGSVEAVDVVRADPPGVFDREAVLAVRRWRYAPADAPSEARVVLQFRRP